MAKRIVTIQESTEEWLSKTNDAILACRGQGHAWPKLRPGNARGLRIEHVQNGVYQITFTCPQCKTERTLTTAPGGILEFPASYKPLWIATTTVSRWDHATGLFLLHCGGLDTG